MTPRSLQQMITAIMTRASARFILTIKGTKTSPSSFLYKEEQKVKNTTKQRVSWAKWIN